MVRFLNLDTYIVQKCKLDREYVKEFFSDDYHRESILIVYDKECYCGIISFDSMCENIENLCECNAYMIKERYNHKFNEENIWKELNRKFEKKKNILIPVFNDQEDLLFFAYQDMADDYDEWVVERIIQDLEQLLPEKFFRGVYDWVEKIRIYDCNEFGYRFYMIMKKCGYYVETVGDKWKDLFPEAKYYDSDEQIAEAAIMNVYAEGKVAKEKATGYWWQFLVEIAGNYYRWLEDELQKKCKNLYLLRADIPMQVEFKTLEEKERWKEKISFEVLESDSDMKKELFWKAFGRKITWEEWRSSKRVEDDLFINGEIVKTKYIGDKTQRKVYVIGPCIVRGITVPCDEETLLYCLHERLKKSEINCCVIGIVVGDFVRMHLYKNVLESLTITEDDIVISIFTNVGTYFYEGQRVLDLKELYGKRDSDWFYNVPIHTNYAGNQAISEAIVNNIALYMNNTIMNTRKYLQIGTRHLNSDEEIIMRDYIQKVKQVKHIEPGCRIGAIVMNGNPMTKGHMYLIDTAHKSVDYLYIFVVEEERSEFSFSMRYAMVQKQTEFMENVIVVPSGQFILSYKTMPLYFEKSEKQEAILNATNDLQLFCQYIAPSLGITERFVGEEPIDKITKQYNDEMKYILPYYGIRLIQIPRVKYGEEIISASRVRKMIKDGNWETVQQLVPEKVLEFLKK